MKRVLTVAGLAAGLLVSPVETNDGITIGARSALAEKECKLEIELCQEIDLVFYSTRACWTVKLFCG